MWIWSFPENSIQNQFDIKPRQIFINLLPRSRVVTVLIVRILKIQMSFQSLHWLLDSKEWTLYSNLIVEYKSKIFSREVAT